MSALQGHALECGVSQDLFSRISLTPKIDEQQTKAASAKRTYISKSRSAPIAGVESPGALAVLRPRGQAQPAELVAALAAGHVHAALVLLDGPLALGAGLGVGQDPVQVLRLCAVLDDPLLHRLAVHLEDGNHQAGVLLSVV